LYYSIEKFRAAYAALIPAMPDKSQWPESDHGFYMHPPLLKATAGRPKTEGIKVAVTRKEQRASIYAQFVRNMGIIGPNVKRVTWMTLLQ
jgi:hypothetical protein